MNAMVAVLTPPGRSARASVGLWGPDALALVQPHFVARNSTFPSFTANRPWLGRIEAPEAADEVVLVLAGSEAEPRVEVLCHGGRAIVAGLVRLFTRQGAVERSWSEWLAAHSEDHLQGEAAAALSKAPTLRCANHLLVQHAGALRRTLLDLLAQMSFPLEGIGVAREKVLPTLDRLVADAAFGLHLTQPWKVVVAGPANAGKSSLINALVGFQRSITAPTPGTTRDFVSVQTAMGGWPIELIDTAGWREGATGLEAQGIAKMKEEAAKADLVLWVTEAHASSCPCQDGALRVRNKADLLAAEERQPEEVAAATGFGLERLQERIIQRLIPAEPAAGSPLPFLPRHVDGLRRARAAAGPEDWQAARAALQALLGEDS